jgi:putative Mg2+ transporter-C (MgtC) family protein
MTEWEPFVRVAVGTILGGVIGYERDVHGRPAGLRTHMIVGLASAAFMVVSTRIVYYQHFREGDLVEVDASRIASSIVTGMGFLAGGAIFRTGITVQGLTTAAALWLVGSIGMAAGSGMYAIACFVTLLGVLSLTILRRFEDKDLRSQRRYKVALLLGQEGSASRLSTLLREKGMKVSTLAQERKPEEKTLSLTFDVHVPAALDVDAVIEELAAAPAVRSVKAELVS